MQLFMLIVRFKTTPAFVHLPPINILSTPSARDGQYGEKK